jgi:hypothetical protein
VIRGALFVCSLTLLTSIGIPNLGDAREPESEQPMARERQDESEQPEGREQWRELLLAANQQIASAQKRNAAALRAYKTMRHRRRPRGDAKQAIMDEIGLSHEDLLRAQKNLETLERAARRADAPSSWLKFDPAEIDAPTQVPASQEP